MARVLAVGLLRLVGWRAVGIKPMARRYILIAAPHTSNWDLPLLLAMGLCFGVRVSWMGKHSLFRGPLGPIMRRLGGIPVQRGRRERVVDQMARAFETAESLALAVPAEGTRSYATHWKSGFYHIARAANVPIVMGYLDYAHKRGGFGPEIVPTGDIRRDMDQIRAFYSGKVGRYPAQFGAILLEEEGCSSSNVAS